jgi:hypothetical protein
MFIEPVNIFAEWLCHLQCGKAMPFRRATKASEAAPQDDVVFLARRGFLDARVFFSVSCFTLYVTNTQPVLNVLQSISSKST